jgi:hypothetical protein
MRLAHFAMPRGARPVLLAGFVAGLAAGLPAPAAAISEAPDWPSVADVETVQVVNQDEDGSERDTTVWMVVVDGQGYLRSGGGRWSQNLERDPKLELRIGETSWPLRVEFVEDDALRERIHDAFREKYGFSDAVISLFRGSRPPIMHLLPRDGA